MNTKEQIKNSFGELLQVMDELREKCPWDQKQTFESLRHLTLEEVYELSDAILEGDTAEIKKELGDILLHLVFYARIASESKDFDMGEVIDQLIEKLKFRHPHIYGDVEVENEEEVKQNWEKLKLKEGKKSVLEGVPQSLPALLKAYRVQEKVKGVGFEFENEEQTWDKVEEELREFHEEKDLKKKEEEFGDVLFSLVNYARYIGINPEDALSRTNNKFIYRFQTMENLAKEKGLELSELNLEQQDELWVEAKELLRGEA